MQSNMSTATGAEHFWPNIKRAILQNPNGQPPNQGMKPQCPICREKFSITTFSRPTSAEAPRCEVLFCGHVLCGNCLEETNRASARSAGKICPVCRAAVACEGCRQPFRTFSVPDANTSSNAVSNAPLTKNERPNRNTPRKCNQCSASGDWLDRIDSGNWPREAQTIEPGAGRFLYGAASALESAGRTVTPSSISSAFESVTNDEYDTLMSSRSEFMSQRTAELDRENPWFRASPRETGGGQDHQRSYSRRTDDSVSRRSRVPPASTETRGGRSDFEERRRIHDRLPERSIEDQLRGLNIGSSSSRQQGPDSFAMSSRRHSDRRDDAQQRLSEFSLDGRRRRDAGMTNIDSFGGGRERGGRDTLRSSGTLPTGSGGSANRRRRRPSFSSFPRVATSLAEELGVPESEGEASQERAINARLENDPLARQIFRRRYDEADETGEFDVEDPVVVLLLKVVAICTSNVERWPARRAM